jgi:hypothetical protein
MDKIEKVYFINLDHRGDRYGEFMRWIDESRFPLEKVERVPAFFTPDAGHIGCLASHVRTLQQFLQSDHTVCMVCEDDFMPLDVEKFWSYYKTLFEDKVEFDVVMATYNLLEHEDAPVPYLKRILHTFTSSNYIITREFAPRLLHVWQEALRMLIQEQHLSPKKLDQYCTDVVWMPLMKESRWYCFYPRIGKQRDSFSDVQGHYTTYVC